MPPKRHPSSENKADDGPEMIKYINQVFRDAETLNKKMRDLLTVAASENFTPGDAKAWSKMANAISKLEKKCSTIATMPIQTPASPTNTTPKKRTHMEPSPSSAKKRKMAMVPVQTRSKRRFSDDEDEAVVEVKKRFKRNHREGSERPAVSGKRQEREEGEEGEQCREDVGLKRPRRGYFQDGDPPMEYEESSDEHDDDDETPATVPVSLSSNEDGEV